MEIKRAQFSNFLGKFPIELIAGDRNGNKATTMEEARRIRAWKLIGMTAKFCDSESGQRLSKSAKFCDLESGQRLSKLVPKDYNIRRIGGNPFFHFIREQR